MARICNLLCIALIAIFTIVTADYCNLKSCDKEGSHTMCQFDVSNNSHLHMNAKMMSCTLIINKFIISQKCILTSTTYLVT